MDILKLKSEIEKFQAMTGEDGLLGPGGEEQAEETNFVTDEHAGGAGQAPQTKKSWKQELNDSKTAIPLSIGLAITAGLVYDGVKNRGDEGEIIFTEPWKTMALFVGAGAIGWGTGRIARGDVAVKEAETLKSMLSKKERELEDEKEEIEAEKEKKRETYRMLMSEPSRMEMLPSLSNVNTFGEYGAAVGQQGISYF